MSTRRPDTTRASTEAALTPTAKVILGMLAFGKQTGYDVKQFVDKTTRFFWAASYGQIYPELRRLEEAGLARSQPEPSGARARTVYTLTDAGRTALHDWLASGEDTAWELRDEGMLRLFFSDSASPDERLAIVRGSIARHRHKLEQLRAIEAGAAEGSPGPYLTLQVGIRMTEATIEAWEATERRLREQTGKE
jgi:DNA-binding PadR family transcriptional regulator